MMYGSWDMVRDRRTDGQLDRQMDRRTDGQKKGHIEVGGPRKNTQVSTVGGFKFP